MKLALKYTLALSAMACLGAVGSAAQAQSATAQTLFSTASDTLPLMQTVQQGGGTATAPLLLARHDDRHGRGAGPRGGKNGPPHAHRKGPPPHAQRKGPPPHAHHARPAPRPHWHDHPPRRYVAPPPRVRWSRGDILPPRYRHSRYVVHDWRSHRYAEPPRGYQWMRVDGELLLVGIATGMVLQSIIGR